jgi:hypothetical protein
MNFAKRFACALLLSSILGLFSASPLRAQARSAKDPLLDSLNGEFRAQYKLALTESLEQAGPLILEEGDDLILVRNGERTRVLIKPVEYHELKAVAHIPLAIFLMLSFAPDSILSIPRIESLQHYRDLMVAARSSLPSRHLTPEQLSRQQKIFSASFELLDGVIAKGEVNRPALESFTRQVAPLLMANVADATAAEMRELYKTVLAWQRQLSPAEWARLHMVMIGPHMPREQEASIQFFERLFHEPIEGRRIIYAESLWKEQDALNLLATHVVDEAAGEAFFGDPMRMHRDLLADAAKAYLDAHPFKP